MNLQSDITTIKGVGEKSATLFRKLHIETVQELLFFFPSGYETFQEPIPIASLPNGEVCTIRACVTGVPIQKQVRNLKILTVTVRDATGTMQLTFFNMPFLRNTLKSGCFYLFRGRVTANARMEQPRIYKQEEYDRLSACIQPRYPLTKGLTHQAVGKAVRSVLELCPMPEDPLPEELLDAEKLMPYGEALRAVHFPQNDSQLLAARRRLVFNEFFYFILQLRQSKEAVEKEKNSTPMIETAETGRFLESLPYKLTGAQQKAIREICGDMTGEGVMSRLVQGDVGSGKTIVAVWALLLAVSNGYQAAMMAPTEVLARQHFETIRELTRICGLPFRPVLLCGSMTAAAKRGAYEALQSGEANLVLGTHAVIQEKVSFHNLALVITDEQHRFGVRQRELLKEKGAHPHVLVMSATPIPRTLAIILYGDLHVSVIDELPGGRMPIKNCVVDAGYRPKAYAFLAKEVAAGRQAYCICPMVEEGELEGVENVMDYTEKLRAALPATVRVTALHGKMRPADKNRIMDAFSAGEIDVLVSTTVIEVGINVPNATVMLVENAERFGLSQLHQLRGRVGRGSFQSYCIFIRTNDKEESLERLSVLNHSNDGFFIAEEDLRLRGPGDLFGIRQSGEFSFRIGDVYNDAAVLKQAGECAEKYGDVWRGDARLDAYYSVDFTTI